jgi:hypothetical protein
MAVIMEMMVSLLRDTVAKGCRGSGGRRRPWWRASSDFLKIRMYHIY